VDELLNSRLYLGSILGMEALAYDEIKLPVASRASLLEGTVSVVNGLLYIETVQVDLVGLTVLLQDGFKNTTATAMVGTLLFSGTRVRSERRLDAQTVEDALAGLLVELMHATLVLLALVRELLCKGSVASRICHVAPLKAPGHGIALFVGLAAEVGIIYRGRLFDRGVVAAEEAVESFEETEHVEGQRGRARLLSLSLSHVFSLFIVFFRSRPCRLGHQR